MPESAQSSPSAAARARLLDRVLELARREEALARHLRGADGRLEADSADRGVYLASDEVLEQLDEGARAEVLAIRGALDRMDAGTWGVCATCGDPIAPARLEALPHVATCVRCAG
jgi:DnaK suppressor protein